MRAARHLRQVVQPFERARRQHLLSAAPPPVALPAPRSVMRRIPWQCRRWREPRPRWRRGAPGRRSSPRRSCRCSRCPTAGPRTSRSRSRPSGRRSARRCPGRASAWPMIGSPASVDRRHRLGRQLLQPRLLLRRRRRVDARVVRRAELARSARGSARPDPCPVRAVISAASRSMIRPSLSVVHTVPSRRRKLAPALSSPPKQNEPSNRPGDEPLEADRHLAAAGGRAARRRGRSCCC